MAVENSGGHDARWLFRNDGTDLCIPRGLQGEIAATATSEHDDTLRVDVGLPFYMIDNGQGILKRHWRLRVVVAAAISWNGSHSIRRRGNVRE